MYKFVKCPICGKKVLSEISTEGYQVYYDCKNENFHVCLNKINNKKLIKLLESKNFSIIDAMKKFLREEINKPTVKWEDEDKKSEREKEPTLEEIKACQKRLEKYSLNPKKKQ